MHPIMGYEITKARIADLHRQADRDRMARPPGSTARKAPGAWYPVTGP